MFYRGSAAAVLVFDITNEESFEKLKDWVKEIRSNVDESIVFAIAANKVDLKAHKKVSTRAVVAYAESIRAAVFETSAKNSAGVGEMFAAIARQLIIMYKHDSGTFVSTQKSEVIPSYENGGTGANDSSSCAC
eukprot:TRINITY_DN9459_c0_g1_i1.p1 TRINITY_DN9459_c0_g1~~TRINITY_DN9459_c0_g1_i1.p1  ORF type:complete len:133 (-),score=23.19 TRINITY_DN9459_c0_g1_i1:339-737(-)